MKTILSVLLSAALLCAAPLMAQETPAPAATTLSEATAGARSQIKTNTAGNYAADVAVIRDGQAQALEQARHMLEQAEDPATRTALETAVKEMERSQKALAEAGTSPGKLPSALAAQQAAYQALLKTLPREFRVARSQSGGQNGGAGQPNRREMNQLEMTGEENRYETERQATAAPTARQREQSQTADRLKQLAQRQQDLNDRLRELQTALQEARTNPQREEIQRQLQRLRDEERQMLADVDELRQQLAQSPSESSSSDARQQLDQTRSDVQRAAQELEQNSASQALAAGTRAQQGMQNLRENLRRQTASQFSEQMRQLRTQARDLARREDDLARGLESLNDPGHKALDDSAKREELARQMSRQQGALTNLLAGMRRVTEQAEATEPLLSQKLYDTLRREDQLHTGNLLDMGAELVNRGFLDQAGEAERSARQQIHELRQGVERAAESVLGSEADALRYAQNELDDLAGQVQREMAARTNAPDAETGRTNSAARMAGRTAGRNADREAGTNSLAGAEGNDNSQGEPANRSGNAQRNGEPGSAQNPQTGDATGGGNRTGANRSEQAGNNSSLRPPNANGADQGADGDRLRQIAEQLGQNGGAAQDGGPITGGGYLNWSDRLRDVEQVLDSPDLRNQLGTVRERVGVFRGYYRDSGRIPDDQVVRDEILTPLTQVRVWVQEQLARQENAGSLVPLDRDPVPDKYSELVRQYYEKLGSAR